MALGSCSRSEFATLTGVEVDKSVMDLDRSWRSQLSNCPRLHFSTSMVMQQGYFISITVTFEFKSRSFSSEGVIPYWTTT